MKKKYLLSLLCIIFFVGYNANAQSLAESINASDVINKAIAVMGGKEYLKTITTLYTDTRTEMEGREVHFAVVGAPYYLLVRAEAWSPTCRQS